MSTWPPGYTCAPDLGATAGRWSVRPIQYEDREQVRQWRNAQIDALRQASPLTSADQDAYFADVVRPQLDQSEPRQVLVAFEEDGSLVGYGGFVHVSWPDRRAELSFLMETGRARRPDWADDWRTFLPLLASVARDHLHLHRLTTETFAFRTEVLDVMSECGFVREGVLRQHHRTPDGYVDSVVCGMLLDA